MAYNSHWTGTQIDNAISEVRSKSLSWDNKQNKLIGRPDQIVGFNQDGNMVPKDAGDGNIATEQYVKDYVAKAFEEAGSASAIYVTVDLQAGNWTNKEQTVYIDGISADEREQLITPIPASSDFVAYGDAEVHVKQRLNQLTFTCENVPIQDITMYVVILPLEAAEANT